MKRPYLNQEDRKLVYLNTTQGAFSMLDIAFKRLGREIMKTPFGFFVKWVYGKKWLVYTLFIIWASFFLYSFFMTIYQLEAK